MDSNLQWVEQNLQKQRKILEEKQKQRRLQSAGPVRATFNSPFNSANASSNYSSPIPTAPIVYRHAEDLISHSISTNPPGSLSLSSEPYTDFDAFSTTTTTTNNFSTSMTTIPSRTPPIHQSSPINESKTLLTNLNEPLAPPINSTKLMGYSDNEKAESGDDGDASVQPWEEEAKLDEAVLEDCSKIDVTKALEDLRPFVNGRDFYSRSLNGRILAPVTRGYMMRCNITRDKKGVEKGWYPAYYLHWDRGNDRRHFLLAARRRKKSLTGSYLISTDPTEMSRDGRAFVGKVRSNAMGTCFTVYDNGENPKKASSLTEGLRQELAAVIYEPNVFGFKGPRKMTIIIPAMEKEIRREFRPICEKDSIVERFKQQKLEEMVVLQNKTPMWSEETQSFVLNFRGRVTQASVKNFQLIHEAQPDYVIMQFGRTDDCSFTLDFRYPLTPLQAFGIAMSSFHGKLACE